MLLLTGGTGGRHLSRVLNQVRVDPWPPGRCMFKAQAHPVQRVGPRQQGGHVVGESGARGMGRDEVCKLLTPRT